MNLSRKPSMGEYQTRKYVRMSRDLRVRTPTHHRGVVSMEDILSNDNKSDNKSIKKHESKSLFDRFDPDLKMVPQTEPKRGRGTK